MADQSTWEVRIGFQELTHIGLRAECDEWTQNLMGCEVQVVGKDGKIYPIGIVIGATAKNFLWHNR